MPSIKYLNLVLADKKSFLMLCFCLHRVRLWDHNHQGASATFKLTSTRWWQSNASLGGPQDTPEIKTIKQSTFKWRQWWGIGANERKHDVKHLLLSSPKVLFSSLTQANSHCLPTNTLLAIKRLCSSRGSEFTSSTVSRVCEPAGPHQTEGEIHFFGQPKRLWWGKKDFKTLKEVCLWFFLWSPFPPEGTVFVLLLSHHHFSTY